MSAFTWALLVAFIWSIVPLFEKLGLAKVAPLAGLFYRCCGVLIGLFLLGVFIVKPQKIKSVDLKSILWLVLGGFLASFVAQVCFYNSLKIIEISKVVPISSAYPLIAFILGVLFLGESGALTKMLGVAFFILGIWAFKIG